jgi:phenylalanyl-tRNA synthetase beta chain
VLRGNVGRGIPDAGVFETGLVFRPGPAALPPAPRPSTERRPSAEELAALDAALPHQPRRVAVALSGQRVRKGWAWDSRPASWYDAVEAMQVVARSIGTTLRVSADRHAPWHPGRCAALWAGDTLVGHAGELHPGVCATVKLPARSCAAEVDLDLLFDAAGRGLPQSPVISKNPPVNRDVALVVDRSVPAAEVAGALRAGAGPWLEELRLLDRYEGEQAGPGRVSLAYRLVLRSPDRTLTDEDANAARDAAVTAAAATGAVLRT